MRDSELELEFEAELEDLMSVLSGSRPEYEVQGGQSVLSFRIPDAPYSDEAMHTLHKSIDAVDAAHVSIGVFGGDLLAMIGAPGLAIGAELLATLAGALVGVVGPIAAVGAGVAGGRAKVSKERLKFGFAFGVIMGAHGRKWPTVKSMYWQTRPDPDYVYDPGAGVEAQKAFNLGLATGFTQGSDLAKFPKKKSFFWNSLYRVISAEARAFFLGGTSQSWSQSQWQDFYSTMMGAFIRVYMKD